MPVVTYALVDNATLTAVQRVLGDVEIKNPDTIDGDLAAFENLIQALLFFDDVVCLDDYKGQYRQQRRSQFEFVDFYSPTDLGLEDVQASARRIAKTMRPKIVGGRFQDEDFAGFIDLLKLNMVCTWDLRSSVYYLTLKMLGAPETAEYLKYSDLSAAIFAELSESTQTVGQSSRNVELISSSGEKLVPSEMARAVAEENRGFGGASKGLEVFVAALAWPSYKCIYYSLAARYLHADTFLHPIRHAFQVHWMKKSSLHTPDFSSKLVAALSSEAQDVVSSIVHHGRSAAIRYEIPLFSASLIGKAGDPQSVLQAARDLRSAQPIEDIRGALREIRSAYDESGFDQASPLIKKWNRALSNGCKAAGAKYGVRTPQGVPSSVLVNGYNAVASAKQLPQIPEFNLTIPIPKFLQSRKSRAFGAVVSNIVDQVTTIERLGSIRDSLASSFKFKEGWEQIYSSPKTEDPAFYGKASHWKLPM